MARNVTIPALISVKIFVLRSASGRNVYLVCSVLLHAGFDSMKMGGNCNIVFSYYYEPGMHQGTRLDLKQHQSPSRIKMR